jgi:hypothetical protein
LVVSPPLQKPGMLKRGFKGSDCCGGCAKREDSFDRCVAPTDARNAGLQGAAAGSLLEAIGTPP